MNAEVRVVPAKGGSPSTLFHGTLARLCSRRFVSNYLSTLAFIGLSYWIITALSNFHRSMLQGQWQLGMFGIDVVITVHAVFVALIAIYAVILVPYYAAYPWMRSKAFTFAQGLWFALRRDRSNLRLSSLARQAGLALLLKFFFAPLMINWCLIHIANLTGSLLQLIAGSGDSLSARELFDTALFWAAFQLILFVDTLLFTIGYIIELPALGNRIRSVDPTFFGWFICLACYPPFNDLTLRFLEWQSSDFPQFSNDFLHLAINSAVLVALALFSWASIALGFKASNLTNRGIVTHGPYAFVRHPGYAAKNLAWWLGALPILGATLAAGHWRAFAYSLIALFGWTAIYALRALTEERHLLLIDNGYAQYAQKVRWRFVPGLW
ncbi:methyltransferase family protein [Steroidobacter cummioxidans]|uniref:methyltransferase family protein n=1 Tax=Steroidobacter cummioxidans TaxID=1803913 RepID=UPI000E314B26|nr:isoprenylcysteine carboxylmethyltransferase family protein [Steroidobacter cummioxidans]